MIGNGNKYNLTYPQKNIWLVDKFYGDTPINTIAGTFDISKGFNIGSCEKAINKMIEMNEILRISIFIENGQPMQRINAYVPFEVDTFDMSGKSEQEILELENNIAAIPMNIDKHGCYSFAIVDKGNGKGSIIIKLHHIVSDAWTFGRVGTSLAEYIEKIESTTRESIEDEKPSYVEYIEAEKEYIENDRYIADKEFWTNYLEGINEVVGLKEETKKISAKAQRYSIELDKDINSKIIEYAKANRLSPYTIFMTALAIYINRTTSKQDFVLGTPVLNRSNFKEKQMMGMFVSTIPVRYIIDEKEMFLEMCKKNATEFMTLFRHQKYPYSLTLEEVHKKTDIKDNLYKVVLSYQNAKATYPDKEKYSTNWIFSKQSEDDFAIHIMDLDSEGTMHMHFDYRTDLFERVEVEHIASRILAIIEDGIDNNKTVENIEIMTAAEKNKILYEFNETDSDYPMNKNIIEIFEEQVEKTPDNIALVFEDKQMTYRELNEKANSVAGYLQQLRIKNVILNIKNSMETVIYIYGILKSGAIYIPIDESIPKQRVEFIIKDSKADAIISSTYYDDIYNINRNTMNVDKSYNLDIIKNKQAYTIYTSGTTGNSKGVRINQSALVNYICWASKVYSNKATESISMPLFTSIGFDLTVTTIFLPLITGGKIVICDSKTLENIFNDKNIDTIKLTPAHLEIISHKKQKYEHIKTLILGGEALKTHTCKDYSEENKDVSIFNEYGPTEATVGCMIHKYDQIKDKNSTVKIGKPANNTQLYVLSKTKSILPFGVEGELYIAGDGLFDGYNNIDNNIDTILEKKMYKTGDNVKLDFDMNMLYIGRKDNQVKLNGYRIELDEISSAIKTIFKMKTVVTIINNINNIPNLSVYYVDSKKYNEKQIKKELNNKLPKYMIPNIYIKVDNIPLNINGKTDIEQLKKIKPKFEIIKKRQKRKTEKEVYVCLAWEKVINIEGINPTDSIFDLGVDSLNIIKCQIELASKYGIIDIQQFYEFPVIRDFCKNISKKKEENRQKLFNELDKYKDINFSKDYDKKKKVIMLAGVTGFLGVHILKELVQNNDVEKIYCIIRGENYKERIKQTLKRYFTDDSVKNSSKIICLKRRFNT